MNAEDNETYVSTVEAGRKLGRARETIYRWCKAGKIPGARQLVARGEWEVPVAWLRGLLGAVKRRKAI